MAAAQNFTELLFWQRARQWSKAIFQLTLGWSEECWQPYERITGRQRPEMFRPKIEEDEEHVPRGGSGPPREDRVPY